ncbi:pyridoxal-phosphate dependent enzyme [Haloarcula sp. CBA1130]|uniref:pyridoxal-phosphate dependent enzyme n=1 Tax=unclassified Haloarcula TaxID=2624677 RepID=UPI001246E949|nr:MULTISPECIES: pyridoxal-phosphate dependent enzyme [unclassified Haloarcula]KAA9399574.1 pyridoxal-phosphate dependent enzyme [Haloarcula sp. CBA1129]KAA9401298.1 pyridoxal-phosphate dependent enzyme [Haloarcula sp. CBA1130]
MRTCSVCDREYLRDEPWRCSCGEPLDYATQPLPNSRPDQFSRTSGVWDFVDFLPMRERVSLGEGWTPLVDAPEWDASFKLEYLHPTGSFKDRGAATVIAEALVVGADRVLEDSSGNAGLAVASYAARAGLDAEIYVPEGAKEAKVRRIERTGADVVPVAGSRESVTAACIDAVESGPGWYASHAWNPAFFAGTATTAYEIAAQRDWNVPDAVVTPLGHGTLFLGLYRGFRALEQAGWTDAMPRILGAQAVGYSPIAAEDGSVTDADAANDLADGIHIRDPPRAHQIRHAIEATGGAAVAVSAAATEREHARLGAAGFHVEPTCATATAALTQFREQGELRGGDDVVVALTGRND